MSATAALRLKLLRQKRERAFEEVFAIVGIPKQEYMVSGSIVINRISILRFPAEFSIHPLANFSVR